MYNNILIGFLLTVFLIGQHVVPRYYSTILFAADGAHPYKRAIKASSLICLTPEMPQDGEIKMSIFKGRTAG
ncbi:hypothetical protein ACFOET_20215 [Parapedobacter deserti]|uniref:Uncharacterized protein n=1 Tax=Parapedobacter deserti TaxID=1912957 RepID=A0ABV7JUZ9_9SPHI